MNTKDKIVKILDGIPDPEIGVSIWQLGLVYGVNVDDAGKATITMTLTSLGCPLFDQIAGPIRQRVGKLAGVKKVDVELTFEPPWSPDKMTQEAKMQLGFV